MKKLTCVLLAITLCFVMCACGSKKNAPITSNWKTMKMTVGNKTETDEELLNSDYGVKFHTDNGKDFEFVLSGKSHTGTLTKDGDKYILNYDDTDKKMEATIDGNNLYISIVGGASSFEFVAE